jgi:hypothetical protein
MKPSRTYTRKISDHNSNHPAGRAVAASRRSTPHALSAAEKELARGGFLIAIVAPISSLILILERATPSRSRQECAA